MKKPQIISDESSEDFEMELGTPRLCSTRNETPTPEKNAEFRKDGKGNVILSSTNWVPNSKEWEMVTEMFENLTSMQLKHGKTGKVITRKSGACKECKVVITDRSTGAFKRHIKDVHEQWFKNYEETLIEMVSEEGDKENTVQTLVTSFFEYKVNDNIAISFNHI